MPKLFFSEHTYSHPWETVTCAFWQKYPHDKVPHVSSVDVLDRRVDTKTGNLITTRLVTGKSSLPEWVENMGIRAHGCALERSIVDPVKKEMVLTSKNLTYANLLCVEECCIYRQDPKDSNRTQYEQSATISVSGSILSGKLENLSLGNFARNAARGLDAMEEICKQLVSDGMQHFMTHCEASEDRQ